MDVIGEPLSEWTAYTSEACCYQPLIWCINQGVTRFEGGAQGEHKMARALLPVATQSAHWLAHPAFARAVDEFLTQEGQNMEHYLEHLKERNPLKDLGSIDKK
jgi:predicted N-acyltransferase